MKDRSDDPSHHERTPLQRSSQKVISNLKSKKSGIDNLLNEYFIVFQNICVPILSRLFNVIFDSGDFPPSWSEGIINSLCKKCNSNDTNNYRAITLISCLENIFTAVLNTKFLKWSEEK